MSQITIVKLCWNCVLIPGIYRMYCSALIWGMKFCCQQFWRSCQININLYNAQLPNFPATRIVSMSNDWFARCASDNLNVVIFIRNPDAAMWYCWWQRTGWADVCHSELLEFFQSFFLLWLEWWPPQNWPTYSSLTPCGYFLEVCWSPLQFKLRTCIAELLWKFCCLLGQDQGGTNARF